MNVTEHYRSTLDELTFDRPGGPDLDAVIAGGRRRRRVRRTAVVGAGVAALAVASVTGAGLLRQPEQTAVDPGFAAGPVYHDFVAGSDIDETIQATVAQHVPSLVDAQKVWPSDWNRDTALPDAEAANATDWEAHYVLSAHEQATVSMFKTIPGEVAPTRCTNSMDNPGLACSSSTLSNGSILLHYALDLGTFFRIVTVERAPDGSLVQAFDDVQGSSLTEALQRATLPQDQLDALVGDAAMTFPDPVVTPPLPNS